MRVPCGGTQVAAEVYRNVEPGGCYQPATNRPQMGAIESHPISRMGRISCLLVPAPVGSFALRTISYSTISVDASLVRKALKAAALLWSIHYETHSLAHR